MDTNSFELIFDSKNTEVFEPKNPEVIRLSFERHLAVRLLDILYGRNQGHHHTIVPVLDHEPTQRSIGRDTQCFLVMIAPFHYMVETRSDLSLDLVKLQAAEIIIRAEYATTLLPQPQLPLSLEEKPNASGGLSSNFISQG